MHDKNAFVGRLDSHLSIIPNNKEHLLDTMQFVRQYEHEYFLYTRLFSIVSKPIALLCLDTAVEVVV